MADQPGDAGRTTFEKAADMKVRSSHPSELGKAHSIRPLVISFSCLKSIPVSDRLSESFMCPFWERTETFR